MFECMCEDIQSVLHRGPAARSALEVPTCYLGLHTIWLHRLAHGLQTSGWKWLTCLVSNFGRWMTSIEIHPGARTGRRLFVDHGMGIVIGKTVKISDDVTLHQSVTLGGTTWNKSKCHLTFGNDVVVGTGAKVPGPFTIGRDAGVGSNAMVTKRIPPGITVVGIPGQVAMHEDTEQRAKRQVMAEKLGFGACGVGQDMSDLVVRAIGQLLDHLQTVNDRLEGMCQTLTALGNDYYVEDLPVLCEEGFAEVKDEDGNPVA